ncbi:metalloregulator ArsR/SmtB family transcription factor [Streptomyces sp. DSM 3412]|uniref:Metalloregulator ArsR/SmtB family transcription factor n=1 Tax=Streptomyces gottesmaniae TaxID=3075518 RepID=A0ABU2ZE28_9ACTN|nr:metalloregulator ArsR/SmtB family transcription factor [Streptomyces sp. DSM 3412]MDT0573662.1 metalloregulator ArsR/SmtB family transcription factor [Streptomyces sp. DSM 3412]
MDEPGEANERDGLSEPDGLSEVADAIADPVRREILMMLHRTPLTAGDIAARFAISRPAISRHLRVLRESGLVLDEQLGRHRRYSLVRSRLGDLAAWLARFDTARLDWSQRLAALETEVHRTRRDRARAEPAHHPRTARHSEEDTA